jgi:hypothetical protein
MAAYIIANGAAAGRKANAKVLQLILASLIVATSVKIWMDFL